MVAGENLINTPTGSLIFHIPMGSLLLWVSMNFMVLTLQWVVIFPTSKLTLLDNPIQNSTFVIHFYTCHQTPCFASLD